MSYLTVYFTQVSKKSYTSPLFISCLCAFSRVPFLCEVSLGSSPSSSVPNSPPMLHSRTFRCLRFLVSAASCLEFYFHNVSCCSGLVFFSQLWDIIAEIFYTSNVYEDLQRWNMILHRSSGGSCNDVTYTLFSLFSWNLSCFVVCWFSVYFVVSSSCVLLLLFFFYIPLFPSCVPPPSVCQSCQVSLHLHLQFGFKPVSSSLLGRLLLSSRRFCRHPVFVHCVCSSILVCSSWFSPLVFVSPSLLLSVCKLTFSSYSCYPPT